MTTSRSIFKGLLAAALLAYVTTAAAVLEVDPFSRWTQVPMTNADRLYTGGPGGATVVLLRRGMGPLRSFDGGVTWAPFNPPSQLFYYIYVAPTAARTWYSYFDGALYRTTDGGDSWDKRSEALPAHTGAGFLSISADPDVLYQSTYVIPQCDFNECLITSAALQVSLDGGRHWQDVRAPEAFQKAFASPVDSRIVFQTGASGLLRSADRGASWVPVTLPHTGPLAYITYGAVTFDARDSSIAYLRTARNDGSPPILSTRDGGETWTSRAMPPAGDLYADPVQRGRAYLFAYFDGAYETRDAGLTWVHVEPFFRWGLNERVDGVVTRGGKRFGLNAEFLTLKELDLNDGALALRSDLWWNPEESGMGLTITHRGTNQTFVAWYAYGEDGAPVWRVVPGGRWNDRTFTGDMYETTGAPYFGTAFDPSKVVSRKVGSVRIQFDNEDSAGFSYQLVSGVSGNKRIVRELFGVPMQFFGVDDNYADLWWNAGEPGWGIAISHQNNNIFATWFVYDAQGKPLWIVMPDAKFTAGSVAPKVTGDIYTTHGPSSNEPYDASKVVATKVGTASITFSSRFAAILEFTVSGIAGTRAITRQPF